MQFEETARLGPKLYREILLRPKRKLATKKCAECADLRPLSGDGKTGPALSPPHEKGPSASARLCARKKAVRPSPLLSLGIVCLRHDVGDYTGIMGNTQYFGLPRLKAPLQKLINTLSTYCHFTCKFSYFWESIYWYYFEIIIVHGSR
jgi:hypothetical protein